MIDWGTVFGNALRAAFGPDAAVYALATIGLNVHFGYTGLLNFGHVGFMMVGAYGLAISVATFGLSMWWGILIGLGCSVLLALVLGVPTLRLRADYFAITTIGTAEILRLVIRSSALEEWTGGVFGLQRIAQPFADLNPFAPGRYGWGVLSYRNTALWGLLVTWGLVLVATLLVAVLMRSPWGRALRAIREDEDAARSLGKNAFGFKMQSLVLGGLLGGLAGIMFVVVPQTVNADAFEPRVTFFAYTILILGGAASRMGPIVGAWIFWFIVSGIDSFMRQAQRADLLPGPLGEPQALGATSVAVVGIGLMVLLAFRPQGIFGKRREMVLDVR